MAETVRGFPRGLDHVVRIFSFRVRCDVDGNVVRDPIEWFPTQVYQVDQMFERAFGLTRCVARDL